MDDDDYRNTASAEALVNDVSDAALGAVAAGGVAGLIILQTLESSAANCCVALPTQTLLS
jgi:hypothetical protein